VGAASCRAHAGVFQECRGCWRAAAATGGSDGLAAAALIVIGERGLIAEERFVEGLCSGFFLAAAAGCGSGCGTECLTEVFGE
jgi:hypothetical protein